MVRDEFKGIMIASNAVLLDYMGDFGCALATADGVCMAWSNDLVEDVQRLRLEGDNRIALLLINLYPAYFKVDDEDMFVATFEESIMLYFYC